MLKKLISFDHFLYRELPLLILLLVLILLRLPNLFEPYWYGDEAIYLSLGVAMKQGARLYADIIDHKTPLIYYLASVPNQLWFRVLNIGWMIATTIAFYHVSLKIVKKAVPTILATMFFVVFTTLPWFEGHIPNGELFVMGFALWGGLLLLYTKFFSDFFQEAKPKPLPVYAQFNHPFQTALGKLFSNTHDIILYLVAGAFFGLAILTKVPAVLDLAGFTTVVWFYLANSFSLKPNKVKPWLLASSVALIRATIIMVGVLVPIIASVIYFKSIGSGQAYLDFGLLYNFRYVQTWGLPFSNQFLVFLFSTPGKFLAATTVILVLTFLRKYLTPTFQFICAWFTLTFFASLLSNRPYPHYFLQTMPALALLIGIAIEKSSKLFSQITAQGFTFSKNQLAKLTPSGLQLFISLVLIASFVYTLSLLQVGLYETGKYYRNWLHFITQQISQEEYYQSFNAFMSDNYQAAKIIRMSDDPYLFIWGTNPMLYALTQKAPTGRFTVSFHIKDFNAHQETIDDLIQKNPTFIVVMKDEPQELPGLSEFLSHGYILNVNFEHFELWKSI